VHRGSVAAVTATGAVERPAQLFATAFFREELQKEAIHGFLVEALQRASPARR